MAPRIVTLDIETAPIESYHWGLWQENIGVNQIKVDWSILSFSAKWLGSPEVIYEDTGGRGVKKVRDDSKVLKSLWNVLDEADIVIGQNAQAFDIKKINARLIASGFKPYSPIRVVDTKLIAKRCFAFTSNRLEFLSTLNSTTRKSDHKKFPGFTLWAECLKDNPEAWAEMRKYNIADTLATEELYLKVRPWVGGHPNVSAYGESVNPKCPKCGAAVQRRGTARTQVGAYPRFQCVGCGGWSRGRVDEHSTAKRRSLLA
jgi:predicted RNA-binding Zn-ribbon protein involved in translation (DUF1610 family)